MTEKKNARRRLSDEERREIVRLAGEGLTNKEIAERMGITPQTASRWAAGPEIRAEAEIARRRAKESADDQQGASAERSEGVSPGMELVRAKPAPGPDWDQFFDRQQNRQSKIDDLEALFAAKSAYEPKPRSRQKVDA